LASVSLCSSHGVHKNIALRRGMVRSQNAPGVTPTVDGVSRDIGTFYAAHRQELYTYALSITGSVPCAEDAVHESIGRLLAMSRLPNELRPYAFRCVRNAALDQRRSVVREREKCAGFRAIFEEARLAPSQAPAIELLDALSEKEREFVVLKVFSGLTFKEIAAVCGARQGTVAASYWRSLQKLRASLAEEQYR